MADPEDAPDATFSDESAEGTCDGIPPPPSVRSRFLSALSRCLPPSGLDRSRIRDLCFLVLCYTCVATSTTLIVGGSAVAILSVGGGSELAPLALSSFFAGSALGSPVALPLFEALGRRGGFLAGSVLGVAGGGVGAVAVVMSSTAGVVAASFPVGLSNGVGLHLRFAAMELVGDDARPFAMTLVLSGGCAAAILGPESQAATRDAFGEGLSYLGLFVMIGLFNALCGVLVSLVRFPAAAVGEPDGSVDAGGVAQRDEGGNEAAAEARTGREPARFPLLRSDFLSAAALALLSWAVMAMPMSILRVAMGELGYTKRLGVTTLELHFLGMYAPGFVTGSLIRCHGTAKMGWAGLSLFCLAFLSNLLSQGEDRGTVASWMIGLVFLGIAWNITFASATMMLSKTYEESPKQATRIQAANDFIMFGGSGVLVVSAGYIYKGGGSGLDGWRLVNFVSLFLLMVMLAVLMAVTYYFPRKVVASRKAGKSFEMTQVANDGEAR